MLNLSQVTRRFRVSRETVQSWIRSGELEAMNVAAQGAKRPMYRFKEEDLLAFEQRRMIGPTVEFARPSEKIIQFV